MPIRKAPSSHARRAIAALSVAPVLAVGLPNAQGTITFTQSSNTNWAIDNGSINIVYDPAANKVTSIKVDGLPSNILDPGSGHTELYPEFAGTPFGTGTQVYNVDRTANYIDVSTTTQSAGSATNANGTLVNPLTYSFHYVLFNNDPSISCYEVINHSASDPATSVGQGQFLMRVNPNLFTNTYQVDTSVNNLGVQASTFRNPSAYATAEADAGRKSQDATTDLTGSGLAGDFGTNFATKYDYSSYEQLHKAQLEYGPTYAVSTVMTNQDTMTGGPTKQNLQFTDTILMQEFLSGHYGGGNSSYVPTQGVDTSRLFGPYVFRITKTNNESGAQLYADDIASIPTYNALFQTDATLVSNGYVLPSQRSSLSATITSTAGFSSNVNNNTLVLSDDATNFQKSHQGYQYWAQISPAGTASIPNIVAGTYRASIYQLGQWGETRYNGVNVNSGQDVVLPSLKFVPENFSSAPPLWTIGTPNRSANEFLNGHNAAGGDIRAFQGSYDYWAEEEALGHQGKVVYYATAVGSNPATNDPNKWISNQWQSFNPGLYDSADDLPDNYANTAPAYVRDATHGPTVNGVVQGGTGPGPATYTGAPWEVHFITTATQQAQGPYVLLSVALAGSQASLIVTLNGHTEIWHVPNGSDPMVRSGEAGYTQWAAFQWPVADLLTPGSSNDNLLTFSVSSGRGDLYDAIRMEIGQTANPSVTGWTDYDYITGSGNTATAANDAAGLVAAEVFAPEPASLLLIGAALPALTIRRRKDRTNA